MTIIDETTKVLEVSLNESDFQYFKETAQKLGVTETEFLRKALKLMAIYAESKENCKNARLILEDDNSKTELVI